MCACFEGNGAFDFVCAHVCVCVKKGGVKEDSHF